MPGSVEVIPTQVDGRPGTRVIVQISDMPSYVESMVLTQLRRTRVGDFAIDRSRTLDQLPPILLQEHLLPVE